MKTEKKAVSILYLFFLIYCCIISRLSVFSLSPPPFPVVLIYLGAFTVRVSLFILLSLLYMSPPFFLLFWYILIIEGICISISVIVITIAKAKIVFVNHVELPNFHPKKKFLNRKL